MMTDIYDTLVLNDQSSSGVRKSGYSIKIQPLHLNSYSQSPWPEVEAGVQPPGQAEGTRLPAPEGAERYAALGEKIVNLSKPKLLTPETLFSVWNPIGVHPPSTTVAGSLATL